MSDELKKEIASLKREVSNMSIELKKIQSSSVVQKSNIEDGLNQLSGSNIRKTILNITRNDVLTGSATWNPGNLADGAGETSASIPVTDAQLGDFVWVSAPYDLQGILAMGYVDVANSVKVRLQNETTGAIDLASGTWRVRVYKQ